MAAETLWPSKPRVFVIWPFVEIPANIFHRFLEIWERDAGDYIANTFSL